MALRVALVFGQEVDLDVGVARPAAHEIMAHQAVEIEGPGGAGIDLGVDHLRLGGDRGGHFARHVGGGFQAAALRHVEDDLELALVVKRQHLHLHPADADQRHAAEQQQHGDAQEDPSASRYGGAMAP